MFVNLQAPTWVVKGSLHKGEHHKITDYLPQMENKKRTLFFLSTLQEKKNTFRSSIAVSLSLGSLLRHLLKNCLISIDQISYPKFKLSTEVTPMLTPMRSCRALCLFLVSFMEFVQFLELFLALVLLFFVF